MYFNYKITSKLKLLVLKVGYYTHSSPAKQQQELVNFSFSKKRGISTFSL